MTNLLAARLQMALSLGFHIVFAVAGMTMPVLMVIAEWRWWKTGQERYLLLAKRWAKGTAILFAIGAVSGTALSFELGLLWPFFMEWSGPVIGPLFSLEGFAFFTEAIFLGIYLYGWNHVSRTTHLLSGGIVVLSGMASAVFVVLANGWMNRPLGFTLQDGYPHDISLSSVLFNAMGWWEVQHMLFAALAAGGLLVAGIHAFFLLRNPKHSLHRAALCLAFAIGAPAACVQPLSGDLITKAVASHQPLKLAALEAHFHSGPGASFYLGGIPNEETGDVAFAVEIPHGLSLLLHLDPDAPVTGLDAFPRDQWPPIAIVHLAFQIMVGCGIAMFAVSCWGIWRYLTASEDWLSPGLLRALVTISPLGLLAIETGWVVTEVGRQPWIIQGYMRTADAVTPMPGLIIPLVLFTLLYVLLGVLVTWLMVRHIQSVPEEQT